MPTAPGLNQWPMSSIAPSWECHFTIVVSSPTRCWGRVYCGPDALCNPQERQSQLRKHLSSFPVGWWRQRRKHISLNPGEWWNKRPAKGDSPDLGIRHRRSRELLQLHILCSSMRRDSGVATMDSPGQNAMGCHEGSSCLGSNDEILSLCAMGALEKALDVLFSMDEEGKTPSVKMYMSLLKECTKRRALTYAKRVQSHLAKHGLESTKFLGEYVVSTLVTCGGLEDALQLFRKLPQRTAFSWTSLISGYTNLGQVEEALRTYYMMQDEGVEPNTYTFVSLLKACRTPANLEDGKRIHAEASTYKCDSDLFVGTCLVCMYAKCGSVVNAQDVFDGLPQRDVVSWNALLLAYVQQGQPEKALHLYEQMLEEGVGPSEWTFVTALQACGMLAEEENAGLGTEQSRSVKCLGVGKVIHAEVWSKGYHSHVYIGNTLISMYGKCGSIVDARYVFDILSARDAVSWTAMLAACVQQAEADIVLELYELMLREGLSPNDRTVVCVLQACAMRAEKEENGFVNGHCAKLESLTKLKAVHANFRRKGFMVDVFVCSSLVSTYSKCGSIVDVQNVFDGFFDRDVVSWNVLLTAHAQRGQAGKVLLLYEQMVTEGVSPDVRSCVCALQACGMLAEQEGQGQEVLDAQGKKMRYLEMGKSVHAEAWIRGNRSDVFLGATLISMYGKCGSIIDAQNVLDASSELHLVSCNAMLSAYVAQGHGHKTLHLYLNMQEAGVSPDFWTFVSALQACGLLAAKEEDVDMNGQFTKVKALQKGRAVHADAWRRGYKSDVFIGNSLVSMYGKCGSIVDARLVFDGLSQLSVVSWNAMLVALVQQGQAEVSLHLYEQLLEEDMCPDDRTFVCALQACSLLAGADIGAVGDDQLPRLRSLAMGKAIHAFAWSNGYKAHTFFNNALISMYGKCRSLVDALDVFKDLFQRDLVSWNAMLSAYMESGQSEIAWQLYVQMLQEGTSPDSWTFVSMLQACASSAEKDEDYVSESFTGAKSLEELKAVHAYAWMKGYGTDAFVGNTLVSMYGRLGAIPHAQNVFDEMSQRDTASWNAMLSAYVEQGYGEEALQLYGQMVEENVTANEITVLCILRACSSTGGLGICRQIHDDLVRTRTKLSPLLATTLIHTYGRCASMVDAQHVFNLLPQPKVVSWNALIAGYARQGNSVASLQCYQQMRLVGTDPNGVTFLSLLYACSHAGLVEKGVEYFASMTRDHGITPEIEHYATVMDLLGRAGQFARIEELLSTMPIQPDLRMWLGLLGACRKHVKVVLGRQAFDGAVCLQRQHAAAYVLMFNIYVDAGLWDCAMEVNDLRKQAGAWKTPGQSWIEHEHEACKFVVADCKSLQQEELYDILDQVIAKLKEEHILHIRCE